MRLNLHGSARIRLSGPFVLLAASSGALWAMSAGELALEKERLVQESLLNPAVPWTPGSERALADSLEAELLSRGTVSPEAFKGIYNREWQSRHKGADVSRPLEVSQATLNPDPAMHPA